MGNIKSGIFIENEKQNPDESVPILKNNADLPQYSSTYTQDDAKSPSKSINFCDDQAPLEDDEPKNANPRNFFTVLKSMTIEPFLFMYSLSYFMKSTVVTNMIMDKACYVHLNYSEEICGNLSNYEEQKDQVETMANSYSLYMNLIQMAPASLFIMFFGQWSDKYGRKPPVILALLGAVFGSIGVILCAYYFNSRLEYMLITAVPSGLTGSLICVLMVVYSYASDVTTRRLRTVKYLFVELAFGLGISFGSLTGGLIYKYSSYMTVYMVSLVGHLTALLWVVLVVSETRGLHSTENWKKKFCDFFSVRNFVVGFQVCMRVRENHGRAQIWLLLCSVCIVVLSFISVDSVGYIYAHHMYDWDPTDYSEVNTIFSALGMTVSILCISVLIKVFKFGDARLGILGASSGIVKNVIIGLALKPWMYYLGYGLGSFFGIISVSIRSILSKLVDTDEMGKVFAFLSVCESLMPIVGNIAITKIFNDTITIFPGTTYMIGASTLVLPLGVLIWISRLKPREHNIPTNTVEKEIGNVSVPKE